MKSDGKQELADSVTLLRTQPDATPLDPSKTRRTAEKSAKPTKTLLVVDDDAIAGELEAEILCREGYKVLQARSAEEALRLAREAGVIDLLITDFSMPKVDGLELSHRFRKVHPSAPVLMVSASLPLLRDGARDLEHVALLPKPFVLNELLGRVRTLLDTAVSPSRRKPSSCD